MSTVTAPRTATLPSRLAAQWRNSDWMTYVVTVILSTITTITSLELWNARLNVPLSYSGDGLPTGAHFKTVREQPWYEYQPLLGAPYGQTYNDFPTADNLHFLMGRLLAFVTPDWATAMNLYFIIGFPLAAVAALWLFRRIGMSRTLSVPIAVLFALAPYHFTRGEPHLWLSSYYVIPFAIAVVIDVIQGKPLWGLREGGPRWLRWASRRTLLTLGILVLTGTAQSYYAVFFLVLIAFAGIVRLIRSGEWPRFWGAAIAGGVTAVVMLINMSPDLLYTVFNGSNPAGFARGHIEAEIYALKLAQLLLPWPGHRIGFLQHIRSEYDDHYPLLSESPALGALGALGLVALFLILAFMAATWGGRRARTLTATPQFRLLGQLAALTFVAFLFSTVGGLSTLISFVTTALRGWNRMSIAIMLLCLAAVGILGDAALRALQRRIPSIAGRRILGAGLATAVLLGGYVDQTPADASAGYAATIEQFDADAAWIQEVEASVPEGSMILQLPYQGFPETVDPLGVLGSDSVIPYLHSEDLRWTGGGIKGRPRSDWPSVVGAFAPEDLARLAAASGAAGIHIDRASLTPADRATLEGGLDDVIGEHLESADGRFAFFPLASVRAELSAEFSESELDEFADRITDPVTVATQPSFNAFVGEDDTIDFRAAALQPSLIFSSDRDEATRIELTVEFVVEDPAARTVELTLPDGSVRTAELDADGAGSATVTFDALPGLHTVTFGVTGPVDDLDAALVLTGVRVLETALEPMLAH